MKNAPKILDCTLRDGSYAVNFQFTAEETASISGRLDQLGFPLIEVGHGIGLGASEKGMGYSAATDEEYMVAAADAVKKNDWGMFCIPGISTLDHVETAYQHEMDFIRIGCEVEDVEICKPFIELARKRNIFVFCNLMKSYAVPVEYFVQQAKKCEEYGAQCIYIVDSAGGMLPHEISDISKQLREECPDVKLGFHGHHNIGMGVANALICADLGFEVVDSSLQGLGRSAGNTPTEQLIVTLIRSGYEMDYDPIDVMQASEELVRPFVTDVGISSLDLTSGLALFHSSYMNRIITAAQKHRIDPRRLILAVCSKSRSSAPEELVEECALSVAEHSKPSIGRVYGNYAGEEQK